MFPASVTLLLFTVIFMYVFDQYSMNLVRPEILDFVGAVITNESQFTDLINDTNIVDNIKVAASPILYAGLKTSFSLNGVSVFSDVSEQTNNYNSGVPIYNVIIFFFVALFVVCALVGIN
jgi:hypothetical protein